MYIHDIHEETHHQHPSVPSSYCIPPLLVGWGDAKVAVQLFFVAEKPSRCFVVDGGCVFFLWWCFVRV